MSDTVGLRRIEVCDDGILVTLLLECGVFNDHEITILVTDESDFTAAVVVADRLLVSAMTTIVQDLTELEERAKEER